MNENIPLFPEQASTVAPEVDALFLMILAISAVVSESRSASSTTGSFTYCTCSAASLAASDSISEQ